MCSCHSFRFEYVPYNSSHCSDNLNDKNYPYRVLCSVAGREGEIATDQIRTVDKSRLKRKIGDLNFSEIKGYVKYFSKCSVNNGKCANNRLRSIFKKDIMKPTTYINWDGLKDIPFFYCDTKEDEEIRFRHLLPGQTCAA